MTNNSSVGASLGTTEPTESRFHPPPPKGKKYSIMVDFEGAKGKDAAKWSSRCGDLIRCHVPVGYKEWRMVDEFYKNNLWEGLLEEFDMDIDPIIARPVLEKKFPQYYRTMKSSLRQNFLRVDGKPIPKRLAIDRCPNDIDKLWWEKFVDLEYSDEKIKQCNKNAENKAKSSITHTLGRKPYHRVHEEMALENPTQKISRTMVWKAAHKQKKTGEVLPCAQKTYALIEEVEEKRKLEGTLSGNGEEGFDNLENDPLAEVFGSGKKRSYCRAISSTSSVKQVKMTQATKAIVEKKQNIDLSVWKLEIEKQVANQVNDAIKSFTSAFLNLIPGEQQHQLGNILAQSAEGSNMRDSPINNKIATPTNVSNDIHSSSKEKQFVVLLSRDLKTDVAKGYLGTQTICHFREVVPNIEKVVWVSEVIDPEAPIYDGPQNGNYKLCDIVDGGFVIWPVFRIRYL